MTLGINIISSPVSEPPSGNMSKVSSSDLNAETCVSTATKEQSGLEVTTYTKLLNTTQQV